MYSTISKDKIDIYKLFVLVTLIEASPLYGAQSHWLWSKTSAVGQNNSEKEWCSYGTAHAKTHTLTGMHRQLLYILTRNVQSN